MQSAQAPRLGERALVVGVDDGGDPLAHERAGGGVVPQLLGFGYLLYENDDMHIYLKL